MAKIADVQEVSLSLLRPYERNAKIHGPQQIEKLKDSIRKFGFLTPCLIDGDLNIIAGHGRVMAAKELEMETVPCVFIEGLTDSQRRAYILADNRLGELGEWDMEIVTEELTALNDDDFDISLTGFDLDLSEPPEVAEYDYDSDPRGDPKSQRGDIYQLGRHRLMCGDATSGDDFQLLMNGERADITITSPPYGAAESAKIREHYVKGKKHIDSFYNEHEDHADEWIQLIRGAFEQMRQWSVAQFINIQMLAGNKRDLVAFVYENIDSLCDVIVWDKMKAPPQMKENVLNNQFEFVFIFGNDSRTIPFAHFHGNRNNLISFSVGNNEFSDVHKAVFPVQFPAEMMSIASKAQTVLDTFGGTGTTMIAAEQLGKSCYMMELDPLYVDLIIDRWETFTGGKAVLLNG